MKIKKTEVTNSSIPIPNGFKQTDIGLIPEDWDVDLIDNHFDVKQGKQISQRTRQGNNQKRFLRTANVFWGKLDLDELDQMHFTREEEEKLQLRFNDLLVCEGGDIGRTALWRNELKDCYYQNHIHRLRLKQESVDPHFFMNWMYYGVVLSNKYFGIGNRTTIPNLSGSRLKAFQFPLPSLPEQKKIAHVLSKIQQAIETQEQIIKTTQELKKALMQKLFTEGLNGEPQKQTEIGPIPESWEVVTIKDIGILKGGKRLPKGEQLLKENTGYPYIRVSDFENSSVNVDSILYLPRNIQEQISRYIINKEDVFISIAGSIGIVGMIPDKLDGANLTENAARIVISNIDSLYNRYLMYFLSSDQGQKQCGSLATKNAQPKLALARIYTIQLPLPEYSIQKKIADTLDKVELKLNVLSKSSSELKELFSALLNNLMTGQIRVKDIEFKLEETAEAVEGV